jgi:carotenoid cleavage dioxygenase
MVHDCAITETQVVLFDLPCTFDLEGAMSGAVFPYRWDPDYGARVGLLPRDGEAGDVRWCELDEPCYVFHPLNAYDAGGGVVVDVVRYDRMFDRDRLGPGECLARLERWALDPSAGKVRRELLSDRPQEFPRHDERLLGREHRYGYCADFAAADPGVQLGALLKHDLARGATEVHDLGAGRVAMEPVFVPRDADAAEDDGFVLAFGHDATRDACAVVVIAAQDFAAPPIATVHLPRRVPFGFHGNWVPST